MRRLALAVLVALAVLGACGDDPSVGDERADQARRAGLDAGLPDNVAEFLAVAARGIDATYEVTYPGAEDADDVVVAADPPLLRVDVVRAGEVIATELATDDGVFTCERPDLASPLACETTSVVPRAPNRFDADTVRELTESLRQRMDDFTFEVTTETILDVEATCLVTRVRAERDRPELGAGATMCISPDGVLLRLDRDGEVAEASEYRTAVADDTFERPDQPTD